MLVRYTSVVEKEPRDILVGEGVELDEGPKYDKEGNDKFDHISVWSATSKISMACLH